MKAFKGGWGQCKTNLNQASELSEDGAVGMNIYQSYFSKTTNVALFFSSEYFYSNDTKGLMWQSELM